MKVMHILNTGLFSGAENVVLSIIRSMPQEIESIYVSLNGPIKTILEENDVTYCLVDKMTPQAIHNTIKTYKPDIIHAHDYTTGVVAALAGTKIPIINHLHNNSPWIKQMSFRSVLYYLATLRFKKILTVSEAIQEEYIFGKLLKPACLVVGNPVELSGIQKKAAQKLWHKQYDIGYMGRMSEAKNPFMFVDIVHAVAQSVPGIKAVMIGTGELREAVQSYIETRGLTESIELLGFQENPYHILKNCKLMCMPSKWEGFGLAAAEALALGLPVVAGDVGGLKDIVNDFCGKRCDSLSEYTEEILKLLSDQSYYKGKSQQAIVRARQLDNAEMYYKKICMVYRELLQEQKI